MRKTGSWFWIIFWMVIFWPIGLFLLLKKTSRDRTAVFGNIKLLKIIYIVLFAVGGFYAMLALGGEGTGFWALGTILCGLFVFKKAKDTLALANMYRHYVDLVINQSQSSIGVIAESVGVPYEAAERELRKMIADGYFVGAQIDKATREIILRNHGTTHAPPPEESMGLYHPAPISERVVTCGSCDANNTIVGQVGECEYCGSPLQ